MRATEVNDIPAADEQSSKRRTQLIVLSALVAACAAAQPAQAACSSALIAIAIVSPTVDFASAVPCSGPGTITISPNTGVRSTTGCLSVTGSVVRGAVQVASNQAKGNEKVRVSVTSTTVTLSAGTKTMLVTGIDFHPKNGPPITQGGKATVTYNVGATLNVGANQGAGSYTGSLTVLAECL